MTNSMCSEFVKVNSDYVVQLQIQALKQTEEGWFTEDHFKEVECLLMDVMRGRVEEELQRRANRRFIRKQQQQCKTKKNYTQPQLLTGETLRISYSFKEIKARHIHIMTRNRSEHRDFQSLKIFREKLVVYVYHLQGFRQKVIEPAKQMVPIEGNYVNTQKKDGTSSYFSSTAANLPMATAEQKIKALKKINRKPKKVKSRDNAKPIKEELSEVLRPQYQGVITSPTNRALKKEPALNSLHNIPFSNDEEDYTRKPKTLSGCSQYKNCQGDGTREERRKDVTKKVFPKAALLHDISFSDEEPSDFLRDGGAPLKLPEPKCTVSRPESVSADISPALFQPSPTAVGEQSPSSQHNSTEKDTPASLSPIMFYPSPRSVIKKSPIIERNSPSSALKDMDADLRRLSSQIAARVFASGPTDLDEGVGGQAVSSISCYQRKKKLEPHKRKLFGDSGSEFELSPVVQEAGSSLTCQQNPGMNENPAAQGVPLSRGIVTHARSSPVSRGVCDDTGERSQSSSLSEDTEAGFNRPEALELDPTTKRSSTGTHAGSGDIEEMTYKKKRKVGHDSVFSKSQLRNEICEKSKRNIKENLNMSEIPESKAETRTSPYEDCQENVLKSVDNNAQLLRGKTFNFKRNKLSKSRKHPFGKSKNSESEFVFESSDHSDSSVRATEHTVSQLTLPSTSRSKSAPGSQITGPRSSRRRNTDCRPSVMLPPVVSDSVASEDESDDTFGQLPHLSQYLQRSSTHDSLIIGAAVFSPPVIDLDLFDDCLIQHEMAASPVFIKVEDTESDKMNDSLKQIQKIQELSNEQLTFLVSTNERYLRNIFQGKSHCRRHEDYKAGGQKRVQLAWQIPLGLFHEDQCEHVLWALHAMFCKNHSKYLDYVLKVMFPEMLIKIYMEIYSVDHDGAEDGMAEALKEPDNLPMSLG